MPKIIKPKRTLVTAALPYANGPLHIGHILEYVQADIFSRFQRLKKNKVIYCCADDTHGTPIEVNAKKQGISPEELIEKFHKEHEQDFKDFLVQFDSYYTTNSEENRKWAEHIFTILKENGFIYQKEMELTYCEHCARFLPDRFVRGKCPNCSAEDQYGDVCEKCNAAYKTTDLITPYCAICKNRPVRKFSRHYFFKLSEFSKKLERWLKTNSALQREIVNFVLGWIEKGLEDWCISRDGPYFGFKIPGDENKYFYVWMDAPIGYIASTENYCKKHNERTEDYWKSKDSEIIHVIGKDIIYFHYLFWPAVLMAAELHVPDKIVVHGYVTMKKEKMSKSRGTMIRAREYLDVLDPELLRFYYASGLTGKMSDVDFDPDDFVEKINNELVANIANFCYRVTSFANNNFNSEIKEIAKDNEAKAFMNELRIKFESAGKHYFSFDFREAVKDILAVSSLGNKYFQDNAPWKLIKEGDEGRKKAHEIICLSVNIAKNLAILIEPVLPKFSRELFKQLSIPESRLSWEHLDFKLKNHRINQGRIIFQKTENQIHSLFQEEKTEGKLASMKKNNLFPLNLKVAEIISVEDHPSADKLYVLRINLGSEERQLVAGIKLYYKKEDLIGKKIIVVTNLTPAKLRGTESNGMLLAAEKDGKVKLLSVERSSPGSRVLPENTVYAEISQITINDFAKIKLEVKSSNVLFEGKPLKTSKEFISVDIDDGAKIR